MRLWHESLQKQGRCLIAVVHGGTDGTPLLPLTRKRRRGNEFCHLPSMARQPAQRISERMLGNMQSVGAGNLVRGPATHERLTSGFGVLGRDSKGAVLCRLSSREAASPSFSGSVDNHTVAGSHPWCSRTLVNLGGEVHAGEDTNDLQHLRGNRHFELDGRPPM